MLSVALYFAFTCIGCGLVCNFWRLVRGPGHTDRILALDTMYVNTTALLILLGVYLDRNSYFEAALLIALMGFVGTVALSKYLLRGDIIE
nr:K+/H+ antiporter subunit F [uncultured Desulfobulbus sp.]